jgi:tetratricopeptide (TPR) repeat protein
MEQSDALRQAHILIAKKDFPTAVRVLDGYLHTYPDDVEALHLSGLANYESGTPSAAAAAYMRMWSVAPEDVRSTYGVAMALLKQGYQAEAENWLRATLAMHPDFNRARNRLNSLGPRRDGGNGSAASNGSKHKETWRPLSDLMIPESDEELEYFRRYSRQKAGIEWMNQNWYGLPWPLRALQVIIGMILLGVAAYFLLTALAGSEG